MNANRTFIGVQARKMKPTKKHRPAIWEAMLGTVNAMNSDGETQYCDYRRDEAKEFAGLDNATDFRLWKFDGGNYARGYYSANPRKGQLVLWVIDKEQA